MNYVYTITPKKELQIEDIRLEIPMKSEASSYFMGFGLPGQETPANYSGGGIIKERRYTILPFPSRPTKELRGCGLSTVFGVVPKKLVSIANCAGSSYTGPLLNLYRPAYPESWYNNGKGGFLINRNGNLTTATAYSGARTLKTGEDLTFDFLCCSPR